MRERPNTPAPALLHNDILDAAFLDADNAAWRFFCARQFDTERRADAPGTLVLRAVGLLVVRVSDQPGQAVYSIMRLRTEQVIGSVVITDTERGVMVATISHLAPNHDDQITTALRGFLGNVRDAISVYTTAGA